jgi:uncharacterized tellurite resistance protein B-like protein
MAEIMTDDSRWVSGLAARLRVLQANFADEQPTLRQSYVVDEIERALKQIPSNRRKQCLSVLADQFPAWQSATEPVTAGKLKPPTAEALLQQFIELTKELPEEARAELVKKLELAGLAPKVKPPALLELTPEAQRKLGLGPDDHLDGERAAKLLGCLTDVTLALDQLVWVLWKQLGPKSNIRREADISRLLGPYLKGDAETSTPLVVQALERTRRLIAALLGGVGGAGKSYAAKYTQRFSPEAILSLAQLDRGFMKSLEVNAWEKFVHLSKQYANEPAIESEIQEAIAKRAENLMVGRVNA